MRVAIGLIVIALALTACSFSEYSQTVDLEENIDDYRTGCDVDSDALLSEYKQWRRQHLALRGRRHAHAHA